MDAEEELVRRSRSGDRQAFARLVEEHQTVARRVATAVVGSGGDADDVVQEAFMRAYTRLAQFDGGRSFRPWLLAIVANEARNRRRSAGRRTALALRVQPPRDDVSAEATVLAAESRAALLGALAGLRDDDRLVLGCRFLLELSEAETAAALDVRPGTVKSRTSRALARLREEVTP